MSDEDSTEHRSWPSLQEQIKTANRHCWDIRRSVEEQRVQRRIEVENERAVHRQNGEYDEIKSKVDGALRGYANAQFFKKLAKEYYVAGVSRFLSLRSSENRWMSRQFASRTRRRIEILSNALRLDKIDRDGGFDSANIADHSRRKLPAGDNHLHRAWNRVLAADIHLVWHIRKRRKSSWKQSLCRAITRCGFMVALFAVFILLVSQFEESGQQIATLILLFGVPGLIAYRVKHAERAKHKDKFIEGVGKINDDYEIARDELLLQLHGSLGYGLEQREFERDPSKCALTEWLREFR